MSIFFWIAAILFVLGVSALASRPLWRREGAAPPVAAHEVAVYKSQLAEVERDLERGAISAEEAEAARREIARRLLAADAAMQKEQDFPPSPEPTARRALLAGLGPLVLAALALYAMLGAPTRPGAPYQSRDLAAERAAALLPQAVAERRAAPGLPKPTQPEPEVAELIRRMEATIKTRPKDPQGRILLARAYLGLQRAPEAWRLFRRAAELQGDAAAPQLFAQTGEAMMLAAGGYVSREAEQTFARAPHLSISRYMLGVAEAQRGEYRRALARWTPLYVESRSAPFAPALLQQIRGAAQATGLDVEALVARLGPPQGASEATPEGQQAAPGPSQEDMRAAASMSAKQRQEMIEGMVSRLADRLKDDPKDLGGWLRLLRAYGVLGRKEEAAKALATARKTFAGQAEALAQLDAAAKALAAPADGAPSR